MPRQPAQIIAFSLLFSLAFSYGTTVTVSSTATASITNFYQDFSYCSCDLTPSLCDNYCCCDASCSTVHISLGRLFRHLGQLLQAAYQHPAQLRVFATHPQSQDLNPSVIYPAFTIQTEEQSEITIIIPKQPP